MFIQENRTRSKLRAGHPAYGVISTSDDPQLARDVLSLRLQATKLISLDRPLFLLRHRTRTA